MARTWQKTAMYLIYLLVTWLLLFNGQWIISVAFTCLAVVTLIYEEVKEHRGRHSSKLNKVARYLLALSTLIILLIFSVDDLDSVNDKLYTVVIKEGSEVFLQTIKSFLAGIPARILDLILPR